jgi:hypothetical protein
MNEGEKLMQKILLFSLFMSFPTFGMDWQALVEGEEASRKMLEEVVRMRKMSEKELAEVQAEVTKLERSSQNDGRLQVTPIVQEIEAARAPQVNALDRNANAKLGLIFGYALLSKSIWSSLGLDSELIPALTILLLGLYLDGRLGL